MSRYFILKGHELPNHIKEGWIESLVEGMKKDDIEDALMEAVGTDKDGRIDPESAEEYLYTRAKEAVDISYVEWEVRI